MNLRNYKLKHLKIPPLISAYISVSPKPPGGELISPKYLKESYDSPQKRYKIYIKHPVTDECGNLIKEKGNVKTTALFIKKKVNFCPEICRFS